MMEHDIFCKKIQHYGFRRNSFEIIKSYLQNRKQTVLVGYLREAFKNEKLK